MTASGKVLNQITEVIPDELLSILPRPVGGVAGSYIDTADLMDEKNDTADAKSFITKKPIWLGQPLSFWGNSLLQKQILTLVEYAAPLDDVEKYIRQAHARNEPFLQATLMTAIKQAVIGLDQTIHDEKGKALDEGMAERLLKLHAELFPQDHEKALVQARLAAPEESKEAKQAREQANADAMGNLFTAFIQNDAKALPQAIETFKTFVKNLKPAVITSNQYYLNLLHLISVAFDVLAERGGNLPPVKEEREGKWYGKLGDRFCFEIIGGALESDLPPRVQQILRSKLYYVLKGEQKANRDIDISGALFRGDNTSYTLVGSSYFDDFGRGRWLGGGLSAWISKLITSNYISIQNLLYNSNQSSLRITA